MKSKECLNENKARKIPLVVICSPTATGKTRLALDLARQSAGEIINADSLQVYRYLDIGTAKPTADEQRKVAHHLIDVVDPDQDFNAALYTEQARSVIEKMTEEHKPAFVVGGTGLYIRALLQGIIDTPPVDENIRNYYRGIRDRLGKEHLFGLLRERDPRAAARINPHDAVRVIRALEVLEQSGQSIVALQERHAFADCPYDVCKIGLHIERSELKKRIARRTSQMLEAGLVEEVRGILSRGYDEGLKPLQSLGYKQVIEFIRGKYDRDKMVEMINRETWQYSKRQMTWFAADKSLKWFAPGESDAVRETIDAFGRER
ncbi:MAG: tRNA (adenosine(37)-N6)-dimethylallyltransferase MiaA [Deltaproteobacteria bacterium]|nr:tRNA (adenosine(37)-N6)-dimethylallyltransferase MiaA [Deltaproteobacteria bacterium]